MDYFILQIQAIPIQPNQTTVSYITFIQIKNLKYNLTEKTYLERQ